MDSKGSFEDLKGRNLACLVAAFGGKILSGVVVLAETVVAMSPQNLPDEFAKSIENGIARSGIHVLDLNELEPIFDEAEFEGDDEIRERLEKFAGQHGFDVHWSMYLRVAVFRKPGGWSANGATAS